MKIKSAHAVTTETTCLLPFYLTAVQAGRTTPDTEPIYSLTDLNRYFIRDPKATFLLTVSGDSMSEAGINSEDVLVVDCGIGAVNGDIVVVALNGELIVKRYRTERGITFLESDNHQYEKIEVGQFDSFEVIGVVVNSFRDHCQRLRRLL